MIVTFGSKETRKIAEGERINGFSNDLQHVARRKLRMLNNSQTINDLKVPPANRLEKLKGRWNGYYSIRVNNQWRLIFRWEKGNIYEVELIDYH